jgi:hypothetical protein
MGSSEFSNYLVLLIALVLRDEGMIRTVVLGKRFEELRSFQTFSVFISSTARIGVEFDIGSSW